MPKLAHGEGSDLEGSKLGPDAVRDCFGKQDGNCISQLSHGFAPDAVKGVVIRECLKPCGFSNRQVPYRSVRQHNSILAPRHAMVTGLKRLCGFVKWAARVPGVTAGTRDVLVVVESETFVSLRVW